MDNLRLPPIDPFSVAATISSIPSLALWYARLGQTSSYFAARGLLSSMSKENFDCVLCQLGK